LITKGFSDLLEIGYQDRPEIFRLCTVKAPPLYSSVVEVDERIGPRGNVIRNLDAAALEDRIKGIDRTGIDAVCVVLMHSWAEPGHELLVKGILEQYGFRNVFLSHRTTNLIKIVSRGHATLVDAYLSAVLTNYVKSIQSETGRIPVRFMQSNGIPCRPGLLTGKNAILSGPAGGVVAVSGIARETGSRGVIGFDMGGTSTDVSRLDGRPEMIYERIVGGLPLQAEALNIVTVAAGGGSVLGFGDQRMTVGPESAGSYPGPACYGFGGPLTITDANLITGRIAPRYFPMTFGPDNTAPLDTAITHERFGKLATEVNRSAGTLLSPREIAAGFLDVANEKMAMAIKEISVSKGVDVRQYDLVCFGGAGGQHACPIASLLRIGRIIIHPLSGVMSAYGIGLAKEAWRTARTALLPCGRDNWEMLGGTFQEMEGELLPRGRYPADFFVIRREVDIRPAGAGTSLTVPYGDMDETLGIFLDEYEKIYGFRPDTENLEIVTVRSEVRDTSEFFPSFPAARSAGPVTPPPAASQDLYYSGEILKAPVYMREKLPAGCRIQGPALVIDDISTIVVDRGFDAETVESGSLIIRGVTHTREPGARTSLRPDPVLLEVFNNLFMGVAAEMGVTLRNTAHSVNMKERLDFSCAVFDPGGGLVANAPHIPVHLGSMSDTVKAVLEDNAGTMKDGDIYLTNNPYRGGSHLPDLTVVCPVFSPEGGLIFFTAARGHHSDIGGKTPGSMPPSANHINDEGILIDSLLIMRGGTLYEDLLISVLSGGECPARNIPERIADIRAQIASARKGVRELSLLIGRYGLDTVRNYMAFMQDNAAGSIRKALFRFLAKSGPFTSSFEDRLDDGTPLRVLITIDGGPNPPSTLRAVIDFTGTGKQHRNDNLNAALSVTFSAVIYVLRCLTGSDIPLNSGCLDPVDIIVPPGTILNPAYPAAVASGNVETSQRTVDVLLGALGAAAASQGTMNNLLFEAEGETPYYETIAGGSGAVPGCPGTSGIQVHMTNTRITDPEVLEVRHPGVRLERFTLRRGSGGPGLFRGGDGVIREIKFLKPAAVSILSERRVFAPYGLEGGGEGKKGRNLYKKANGETRVLGHRCILGVAENDSIVIETPGGGGYGKR
ncbi:MAG: hydantoinase B/oxoprolinase family protein, partial [Candidatus Sulfobium sp.]